MKENNILCGNIIVLNRDDVNDIYVVKDIILSDSGNEFIVCISESNNILILPKDIVDMEKDMTVIDVKYRPKIFIDHHTFYIYCSYCGDYEIQYQEEEGKITRTNTIYKGRRLYYDHSFLRDM